MERLFGERLRWPNDWRTHQRCSKDHFRVVSVLVTSDMRVCAWQSQVLFREAFDRWGEDTDYLYAHPRDKSGVFGDSASPSATCKSVPSLSAARRLNVNLYPDAKESRKSSQKSKSLCSEQNKSCNFGELISMKVSW